MKDSFWTIATVSFLFIVCLYLAIMVGANA